MADLARAEAALLAGDLATADDAARRAGPAAQAAGDRADAARAARLVGEVAAQRGDAVRARYWLQQAVDLALSADAWAEALRARRELALLSDDAEAAATALLVLTADADALALPVERAACHLELARLALQGEDATALVAHLQETLRAPEILPPRLRGEAGLLRAQLLLAIGDPTAAVDAVAQAIALLRRARGRRALSAGLLLQGQLLLVVDQRRLAADVLSEALRVAAEANLPERAVIEAVIAQNADRLDDP